MPSTEFEIPRPSEIRRRILEMAYSGQSVHIPSAFSVVELIRVLHDVYLRYPNNDPNHPNRDFFVLSKGHGVMALYPILEARGWIPPEYIDNYFGPGSNLPGLYEAHVPGCEANTGSLGQGITVAVGLAKSARLRQTDQQVFCLVGDGEMNEGTFWEAVMFAGHQSLSNFTLLVDLNGYQAMGKTKDVLEIGALDSVLKGFGFQVAIIDGHNEEEINNAMSPNLAGLEGQPRAVLAKTVKGKGLSFMENDNAWHYRRLDEALFTKSVSEIESAN